MANQITVLMEKLDSMTYAECLKYVKDGVSSTASVLPRSYRDAFNALFKKLETDYNAVCDERDTALAELLALKSASSTNSD